MMDVKNFPGHKNARRLTALTRLQTATTCFDGRPLRPLKDREAEMNKLTLRIMPQARAEAIRTKKDRSGRGRFSRA